MPSEEHKQRARDRARQWRADNREKHRAYARQWAEENPQRVRRNFDAWYEANKDRVREASRRWKVRNREHHLALQRDDQRKRYLGRDSTAYSYSLIVRDDPCSYCGSPGGTADHIVPLDADGANGWDNLTGACLACNSSKRNQPLLHWMLKRAEA